MLSCAVIDGQMGVEHGRMGSKEQKTGAKSGKETV
jgi:hypothetical protein